VSNNKQQNKPVPYKPQPTPTSNRSTAKEVCFSDLKVVISSVGILSSAHTPFLFILSTSERSVGQPFSALLELKNEVNTILQHHRLASNPQPNTRPTKHIPANLLSNQSSFRCRPPHHFTHGRSATLSPSHASSWGRNVLAYHRRSICRL
jgi:hypothetical protein